MLPDEAGALIHSAKPTKGVRPGLAFLTGPERASVVDQLHLPKKCLELSLLLLTSCGPLKAHPRAYAHTRAGPAQRDLSQCEWVTRSSSARICVNILPVATPMLRPCIFVLAPLAQPDHSMWPVPPWHFDGPPALSLVEK